MKINQEAHLSYCSNTHPGQDWVESFHHLQHYLPTIKAEVSPEESFGVGLRLSNTASEELLQGEQLAEFKAWLKQEDLYVFTCNGFPYGDFHGQEVKDKVHEPDWTTPERLDYSLRLLYVMGALVPRGSEGSISTSPITYRHWHQKEDLQGIQQTAADAIAIWIEEAAILEEQTGTYIHLDMEPEPDGLLENSDEFLAFFQDYVLPSGKARFESQGLNQREAEARVRRYFTLCYDVCHFSLAYEAPELTWKKIQEAGVLIGKVQLSSALKLSTENETKEKLLTALKQFQEPTYLHQVTQNSSKGVKTYSDIPVLLEENPEFEELRAHFHVPVFLEDYGVLQSTQDQLLDLFELMRSQNISRHFEVETYTWDVLPQDLKAPLEESIIRELKWVQTHWPKP
ncbi:metabolite traffic protein EboE [Aureicoccus marinus]|uniref:Xylose isomerase n=1 Tax=Aureicoccus marinus TaxID=754435 RepID=A0A2S7T771_9FLAO|nr:metabolite traffic protein EboE [Aureicoccus marinus]PQJ15428.1 xylose isomerase [Aureicoccus marinus]